jgi:DNA-binding MarR family transcriptional regulator
MAKVITESDRSNINAVVHRNENDILLLLLKGPGVSIAGMAEALGWLSFKGEPQKSTVSRALEKLRQQKMVAKVRNRWELTDKGKAEAKRVETNIPATNRDEQ